MPSHPRGGWAFGPGKAVPGALIDLGLARGAVWPDGDGGDVGQGLGGVDIGSTHFTGLGVEQVEGSD